MGSLAGYMALLPAARSAGQTETRSLRRGRSVRNLDAGDRPRRTAPGEEAEDKQLIPWRSPCLLSFGMINKGDTLLYKTEGSQDVGVVIRVHTLRHSTIYIVDTGYGEEEISPRQVLQVLKAVSSRRRPCAEASYDAAG